MSSDGYMPGRINREFLAAADWCCLTGTAQTSIVWSQLAALGGDAIFRQAAERANQYLMARHDIDHRNPAVRGGVTGSWPVWGRIWPPQRTELGHEVLSGRSAHSSGWKSSSTGCDLVAAAALQRSGAGES